MISERKSIKNNNDNESVVSGLGKKSNLKAFEDSETHQQTSHFY